jgi:hypothetical protein
MIPDPDQPDVVEPVRIHNELHLDDMQELPVRTDLETFKLYRVWEIRRGEIEARVEVAVAVQADAVALLGVGAAQALFSGAAVIALLEAVRPAYTGFQEYLPGSGGGYGGDADAAG